GHDGEPAAEGHVVHDIFRLGEHSRWWYLEGDSVGIWSRSDGTCTRCKSKNLQVKMRACPFTTYVSRAFECVYYAEEQVEGLAFYCASAIVIDCTLMPLHFGRSKALILSGLWVMESTMSA